MMKETDKLISKIERLSGASFSWMAFTEFCFQDLVTLKNEILEQRKVISQLKAELKKLVSRKRAG